MSTATPVPTTTHAEFQAMLRLVPDVSRDTDLETVAELALSALLREASGLALGPVVSVNLDRREVEVLMTIVAAAASEVHQKMGLILAALERGTPLVIVQESTTSRSSEGRRARAGLRLDR